MLRFMSIYVFEVIFNRNLLRFDGYNALHRVVCLAINHAICHLHNKFTLTQTLVDGFVQKRIVHWDVQAVLTV